MKRTTGCHLTKADWGYVSEKTLNTQEASLQQAMGVMVAIFIFGDTFSVHCPEKKIMIVLIFFLFFFAKLQ